MKGKHYILIPICGLAIVLGVSLMIPRWVQGRGTTIQLSEPVETDTQTTTKEPVTEPTSEEHSDDKAQTEATTAETTLEPETSEAVTQQETTQDPTTEKENETTAKTASTTTQAMTEPTTAAVMTVVIPETQDTVDWIDEQLAEYEGQIEEVDIETGKAIIAKLDIDYLNSLSEDGLTEEERQLAKDHLHSRLNDDEYATALSLYRQYIGLLQ